MPPSVPASTFVLTVPLGEPGLLTGPSEVEHPVRTKTVFATLFAPVTSPLTVPLVHETLPLLTAPSQNEALTVPENGTFVGAASPTTALVRNSGSADAAGGIAAATTTIDDPRIESQRLQVIA